MWTSQSMTFYESFITFLIGFSIVFVCLIALAIFIIISSKVITTLSGNISNEKQKTNENNKQILKTNEEKNHQEKLENLAVIISAISEEMKEPVERFEIVSIKEI